MEEERVGLSKLRYFTAQEIKELQKILIVCRGKEEIGVLMSFETYLEIGKK